MNIRSFQRTLAGLVLAGVVVAAAPALAGPPDPWITTKVKTALLVDANAPGLPINVDTNDGVVTLHGKVESAAQRDAAVRVARGIDGVRAVRNLIQVVPDSRRQAVRATDSRIRDHVEQALDRDPHLEDSRIRVASVNRGVVLLDGDARSMSDRLRAVQIAARVTGVRRVASQIDSPEHLDEDWDDDRDEAMARHDRSRYDRNDRAGRNRTHYGINDSWITAKTKMKFMTDPDVPASDINVDTEEGRVTLFGMVPSQRAKLEAERIARSTAGVRAVSNQLRVVSKPQQQLVRRHDGEIADRIENRIEDVNLRGENVDVDVSGGVVRLSGSVQRPADRYQILTIARATPGVRAVRDEIRISAGASARYY